MTINALRGRRSTTGETRPESTAIGETDANIVDCPVCKRPLDAAARRCPACGTRMVAGVQASKAAMFATFGLAVGLVAGATVMGVAMAQGRTGSVATTPTVSTAPSVTSAPIATLSPGTTVPLVPVAATAALKGTAAVNARIASTAAPLAAQVGAADFDSQAVAQILRRLNVEAGAAQALLPALGSWDEATTVHTQLAGFYAAIRATANDALTASIRNDAAYRVAATAILQQLSGLPTIDAASRDLAQTADVELPALDGS